MDASNPRLQLAEHNLATRYQEIKELAAFAHRLGLTMEEDEEDENDDIDADASQQVAARGYHGCGSAHDIGDRAARTTARWLLARHARVRWPDLSVHLRTHRIVPRRPVIVGAVVALRNRKG